MNKMNNTTPFVSVLCLLSVVMLAGPSHAETTTAATDPNATDVQPAAGRVVCTEDKCELITDAEAAAGEEQPAAEGQAATEEQSAAAEGQPASGEQATTEEQPAAEGQAATDGQPATEERAAPTEEQPATAYAIIPATMAEKYVQPRIIRFLSTVSAMV